MTIQKEKYGEIDETISVYCFTLKNNHGVEIKILKIELYNKYHKIT